MTSYIPGYQKERFATTVDRNFICLICFNVLRNPVLCLRNQHCFCRACITKYLENSRSCPGCGDELTVETLSEPNIMVKLYLNELKIRCVHVSRGCPEIVQLQHLERHEASCEYTPALCTNLGCRATVNKRDLIHHESEVCPFRRNLKCHLCGEMTNTLADMRKRIANVERNMATNETVVTKMAKVERNVANVEKNVKMDIADMEGKLKAVNREVSGLKAALVSGFNEMKEVLVKIKDGIREENTRKRRRAASGDKENIMVAGGEETNSVEMFNWHQRTWSPLQSMPRKRLGATSFVYNNHLVIAGGGVDDMIVMNINSSPDLSTQWSNCPVKLPAKLAYHSSVVYNDALIVTGGDNGSATSDCIHEVQLVHPFPVKLLSRMPEPRQCHSSNVFDDNLQIVGGSTSGSYKDNLRSVIQYDIKKNECKQLSPLPYDVSYMATVRWGDNIIVMGGVDKHGHKLDTVVIYNVKTGRSHMLPPLRYKRRGCTAVVIQNSIVVFGGRDEKQNCLKSVEAFNFERYSWEELQDMSKARWAPTAVVV